MITLTSISTLITSLFFLISGYSVFSSWKKNNNDLSKFFSVFLLGFGFQQLFFSLATGYFANNPLASNWAWAIAHIFMFTAISYFLRFPIRLRFPNMEKSVWKATILYSIIGTIILFLNIPKIKPFLLGNGIYNWEVTPQAGATIGIFTTICLLFSFLVFAMEGMKVKESALRARAWLLATGILTFLIGGPLHNFVKTPLMSAVADFLIIFGAFLMVLGVYSR
ncbi:MAG: hypothetical protein ABH967_00125, partial [Patescibacteria group bacterium]